MKNTIMHFLFVSCLKATELVEKKFHFELSFKEKIQLKLHTMMCNACSMYEKQSEMIEEGIKKYLLSHPYEETNIEELKKQIHRKLEETRQ